MRLGVSEYDINYRQKKDLLLLVGLDILQSICRSLTVH